MDLLRQLLDVQGILGDFGLLGLGTIVFAETGLLVGFFLPGDSLLFTAGMYSAAAEPFAPLWAVMLVVFVTAVVGNQLGWYIGYKTGPMIMRSKSVQRMGDDRVHKAEEFFAKHGAKAVLLGRFVPFVRTLVPVLAGVSEMPLKVFNTYNVLGGAVWAVIVPGVGHWLGGVEFIREHVNEIFVGAVALAFVPLLAQGLIRRIYRRSTAPRQ
ncbi:DedA family protein [Corynebacterium epidermidicanis]|uniref:Putative membrane-associated protein n=1 Tax=Corynebacterium epidermidicanis TaxID=1050174 RepID=A0A0G3GT65_9CORY|nr:DedA family protein [Corynebacterium epidermidicanis]AKK02052.1 putative membrane-associated protein [Corynebacterium epidermidicanis]